MDRKKSARYSQRNKDLSKTVDGCIHKPRHWNDRRNSSNKRQIIGDADKLSTLPQDLQWKILSFLPAADAAKTGFVSRRWMTTWKSTPELIFQPDKFPGDSATFVRFINHVIHCHNKNSGIKVFELWLWPDMNPRSLIYTEWIKYAIKQKVQKLVLFGALQRHRKSLDRVFSSTSIVKLEVAIENYVVTWSESFTIPKLQKLKLKFVEFDQASSRDMFSCCPALEKLSIMFCNMTSFKTFPVSSPKLEGFVMCHCPGMEDCSLSFQTPSVSKFIWISCEERKIKLVPTQLFALVISAKEYSLHNESNVNLTSEVIKLTRELFKGKSLVFNWRLVQNLSMVHDLPRQLKVDAFYNVGSLTIGLWSEVTNIRTAMLLISRCVFVRRVVLEFEGSSSGTVDLPDLDLNLGDYCYSKGFCRVKYIRITNFEGSSLELMLVKWLLDNTYGPLLIEIKMNRLMWAGLMYEIRDKINKYAKPCRFTIVRYD